MTSRCNLQLNFECGIHLLQVQFSLLPQDLTEESCLETSATHTDQAEAGSGATPHPAHTTSHKLRLSHLQSTSTPVVRADTQQTGSAAVQETAHSVHLPSPITAATATDANTTDGSATGAADR